jgi:hypothetical protein
VINKTHFARQGKDGDIDAKTMNIAYEKLRKMTIPQLCVAAGELTADGYDLLAYQCFETIRRKEMGIW